MPNKTRPSSGAVARKPKARSRKAIKLVTPEDRKKAVRYTDRGTQLLTQGHHAAALKDFNRALTLDPRQAVAWTKRGTALLNKGDSTGAIKDLSNAIKVDPECIEAYEKRGVARERTGDLDGAKKDYKKSIEIQIRNEIMRQINAD